MQGRQLYPNQMSPTSKGDRGRLERDREWRLGGDTPAVCEREFLGTACGASLIARRRSLSPSFSRLGQLHFFELRSFDVHIPPHADLGLTACLSEGHLICFSSTFEAKPGIC